MRRFQPEFEPGRVYRTRDMRTWGKNPARLASRLVREGRLLRLAGGLFVCPRTGRFGTVPPTDDEVLRAFLCDAPFVLTGSDRWNALGLGTTAVSAAQLVYNTKRSGTFVLGGRRYVLRRVAFPPNPPPEWFVVDLLEHAGQAGASANDVAAALAHAQQHRRFDGARLLEMAMTFGTRGTQGRVEEALRVEAA